MRFFSQILDKILDQFNKGKQDEKVSTISIDDTKELMEEDKFWSIIHRSVIQSKNDYQLQQTLLEKELDVLNPDQILQFDNRFRYLRGMAYRWDLWGVAFIMNGGCSDDCFSDFRGWLIGHGRQVYYNALSDPESIRVLSFDRNADEFEGLSYVPMTVYENKTKTSMPNGIKENQSIIGEEWEEDELPLLFPKVSSKWD
jgi:hypothetical protein